MGVILGEVWELWEVILGGGFRGVFHGCFLGPCGSVKTGSPALDSGRRRRSVPGVRQQAPKRPLGAEDGLQAESSRVGEDEVVGGFVGGPVGVREGLLETDGPIPLPLGGRGRLSAVRRPFGPDLFCDDLCRPLEGWRLVRLRRRRYALFRSANWTSSGSTQNTMPLSWYSGSLLA